MNSCAYAAFAAATTCSVVASSVPYLMLSSMVPWNSRHSWLTRPIWKANKAATDAFQKQLLDRAASPSQPQVVVLLYICWTFEPCKPHMCNLCRLQVPIIYIPAAYISCTCAVCTLHTSQPYSKTTNYTCRHLHAQNSTCTVASRASFALYWQEVIADEKDPSSPASEATSGPGSGCLLRPAALCHYQAHRNAGGGR